jgi:hypothetical protein
MLLTGCIDQTGVLKKMIMFLGYAITQIFMAIIMS